MKQEFYSSSMIKAKWPAIDSKYDTSRMQADSMPAGVSCVCFAAPSNSKKLVRCFRLYHMRFEIVRIYDDAPEDGIFHCGVHVLEYEHGTAYPPDAERTVICGHFLNAYPEAVYDAYGYWNTGKTGATQFFVTEYEQMLSGSDNAVLKYLTFVLQGKHFGKTVLSRLVKELHEGALTVDAYDPAFAAIIKSESRREEYCAELYNNEQSQKLLYMLIRNGINSSVAIAISKYFGDNCYDKVVTNPYILLNYDKISIEQVNHIASRFPNCDYLSFENLYGLITRFIASRKSQNGDVYVNRNDFIRGSVHRSAFDRFVNPMSRMPSFSDAMIESALNSLIGSERLIEEHWGDSISAIYNPSFLAMEKTIVSRLVGMAKQPGSVDVKKVDRLLKKATDKAKDNGIVFDLKQIEAVRMAMTHRLSVISGGPGTGKTMITKLIVEIFNELFPDKTIQLCAPTGKASSRMSDVIGRPACTIHRKIGMVSDPDRPLEEDLLILDECSMIDIEMFAKILRSISDHTSVILIGDYNQLPSVGPGLVLRDLVDSNVIATTVLTSVFRQTEGSDILTAAHAILNDTPGIIRRDNQSDFRFIDEPNSVATAQEIRKYVENYICKEGNDPESLQIITPQNEGALGTSGLNEMMRGICNPNPSGIPFIGNGCMFFVGDRVIQTENNSKLEVYNGMIGHILNTDAEGCVIDFNGKAIPFNRSDMSTVKLGYAITVHKSQGSEFSTVVMPVVIEHMYTLNQALLYTATTRAKKQVVMFGQFTAFMASCKKKTVDQRVSLLSERLKVAAAETGEVANR